LFGEEEEEEEDDDDDDDDDVRFLMQKTLLPTTHVCSQVWRWRRRRRVKSSF
jgi:hypothetical protein